MSTGERSRDDTSATAELVDAGPPSPVRSLRSGDAPIALAVGERVGRFSVLGVLGAGGMGVVYAAYDPELDRRVAIKLLGDRTATREAILRFMREAQAMARLSHPNVVSVYDVGTHAEHAVFIAMEYVGSQTLGDWLKERPRAWAEIRDVLVQAGRGLAAAHASGLVHRDFKPSNVFVSPDGRARVGDFGIARLEHDDHGTASGAEHLDVVTPLAIAVTRTGSAVGTPAYMPPEQRRGVAVDARADQFAFCVTAWEAAYGVRPFAATTEEALIATAPTKAGMRDVPPHVEGILRRGLSVDPADRWPSLEMLLARLADDPTARRRRRRLVVAAALTGVAAMTAAMVSTTDDERDPCVAADRELDTTWNPAKHVAVEMAFRATRAPLAAEHSARAAGAIDRWSRDWTVARRDACRKHLDQVQSSELYDRRVACLTRARKRVDALVELMLHPAASIVRDAPLAAASLPPLDDCANTDALLGNAPLPADLATRALIATIHADIERAETLRTFGKYRDALALLEDDSKRAEHVDYPLVHAEVAHSIGTLQADLDDVAAEATLRRAVEAAAIARSPQLYARAWTKLLYEVGYRRARYDDAKQLRAIAWQAVHLAGDAPDLEMELELVESAVELGHGNAAAAAVTLERAIASIEATHGKDSILLVAPLNAYAIARKREPDRALEILHRALGILTERVSPQHPKVGGMLANIGDIHFRQGRFQQAIDTHRRALAVQEAALGPDAPDLGAALNNLAQPLWALGKWDEAFTLLSRARVLWERAYGHDHPFIAVALSNLGGLRQEQGRCDEAVPYLREALAVEAKVWPKDHPTRAMTLQFLAGCTTDLGNPIAAITLAEEASAIFENKERPLQLAAARFELARALWASGRERRRALAMARESLRVIADDPADKAMLAAGARAGSLVVDEWLRDRSAE